MEYDFYYGNYYGVGVDVIVEIMKEYLVYNVLIFLGF